MTFKIRCTIDALLAFSAQSLIHQSAQQVAWAVIWFIILCTICTLQVSSLRCQSHQPWKRVAEDVMVWSLRLTCIMCWCLCSVNCTSLTCRSHSGGHCKRAASTPEEGEWDFCMKFRIARRSARLYKPALVRWWQRQCVCKYQLRNCGTSIARGTDLNAW